MLKYMDLMTSVGAIDTPGSVFLAAVIPFPTCAGRPRTPRRSRDAASMPPLLVERSERGNV